MANDIRIENWKNIPIEGLESYQVSDLGRVKNKFGKFLTFSTNTHGYKRVNLYPNGWQKQMLVHRLVLMTFNPIENQDKLECNHKDGNKENNTIENLEWVTHKENMEHYSKVLRPMR